jgi:hypothetical protein
VEALLFMLNSIAVVVMVYMGLRDDRRARGTPQTSVFRTIDDDAVGPSNAAAPDRPNRTSRQRAR